MRVLLSQVVTARCGNAVFVIVAILESCLLLSSCASVDTILLTSEKFPPKKSAGEVAVLEQKPTRPHLDLAKLRIGDSWLGFGSLQRRLLNRAAALVDDAVVFASPQTQTRRQVAYEPLYDPWGYNSPYYGSPWSYGGYGGPYGGWSPWWGGYSDSMAVPYDETMNMRMGTAIRYPEATTAGGLKESAATQLGRQTQ